MSDKKLILIDKVPDNLLSNLDSRDVALWLRSLPSNLTTQKEFLAFLGLPWRLVLLEISEARLITELARESSASAPMTRKRGFVQIIDSDPSRIEFPQRSLPIYLLNGRDGTAVSEFESRLRRFTMLEDLRRSSVRQILVISGDDDPVPPDLKDLWTSGFRSYLTFATDRLGAAETLGEWLQGVEGVAAANLSQLPTSRVVEDILSRYATQYPEDRRVIRVRDQTGTFHKIDVTEIDEPERPILEQYSLVEERDLAPLVPEELTEENFVDFFSNPEASWRPYAAGLPWVRDLACKRTLYNCLTKLDELGSEENCVAYISAEAGAGGTTIARTLAWEYAREGYPVLIAKSLPFVPDALTIGNFLTRAHRQIDASIAQPAVNSDRSKHQDGNGRSVRRYETPWIIVYDRIHWEHRDSELRKFRNELERQGRPVCLLVVSGPIRELSYFDSSVFTQVAILNHTLDHQEALELGHHLNRFLRVYGKERQDWQWDQFYQDHTVRYIEGLAAFWVTLSFWIQGQYDLSESIQKRMYGVFKERTDDGIFRLAILEIAAMSSEHLPLPANLLPASRNQWPVSYLLEDRRSTLAALGLVSVSANGSKYWALVHDVMGRFLINELFYDFPVRDEIGFSHAKDAEHLRFLLLRQISQKRELGERTSIAIGEDFATSIFKIDPDHGRGNFARFWREVLEALDAMPRSLRDTSRVFRHHMAISRRRIAKLNEQFFGVSNNDKVALLNRAIEDINFALTSIEYTAGSDSNLLLYNSLANAYLDLAQVESESGGSRQRVIELRQLANDATRRAYEENPTNSYVVETYAKNLLGNARDSSPESAIELCIEALGVLFSRMNSEESEHRMTQLGELADQALALLMKQTPVNVRNTAPATPTDVLVKAWISLAEGVDYRLGISLSDAPGPNRLRALDVLGHPAGRGNMQVIRLTYDLISIECPHAFKRQLELAEQLQATDYRMTPQLRLEYAILLFQNSRPVEGDKIFRGLRRLWRESEHFVHVPDRLRWLRDADGEALKVVRAIMGSESGRAMARVQEFSNQLVPFRIEEFGFSRLHPGVPFAGHISFGHNGPFLRSVTAGPSKAD